MLMIRVVAGIMVGMQDGETDDDDDDDDDDSDSSGGDVMVVFQ